MVPLENGIDYMIGNQGDNSSKRNATNNPRRLEALPGPRSVTALWESICTLLAARDKSDGAIAKVAKQSAKKFRVPELELPHMIALLKSDLGPIQPPPKPRRAPSKPYPVSINGKPDSKDAKQVRQLYKEALEGKFDFFANDAHSEIVLCGCPEKPEKRRILKGETQTWKTFLALLERPGEFWFYKELYEKVEGIPCKGIEGSKKAYQWIRHVKDMVEDALKTWDVKKELNVDDIFDTSRAAGRVYISDEITACVVRQPTVG